MMSLIQVHYPNGLGDFRENNGSIFAFPNEDRFIICCDIIPEELGVRIAQYCKKEKVKVEFFTEQNFQLEQEEAERWTFEFSQFLSQIKMKDVIIGITPCTIYVEAKEYPSGSPASLRLIDFLQEAEGVVRAHILFKDRMITLNKSRKPKETKEIQPEMTLTHPVTDDDITNLKIELHSIETVEDFLKTF